MSSLRNGNSLWYPELRWYLELNVMACSWILSSSRGRDHFWLALWKILSSFSQHVLGPELLGSIQNSLSRHVPGYSRQSEVELLVVGCLSMLLMVITICVGMSNSSLAYLWTKYLALSHGYSHKENPDHQRDPEHWNTNRHHLIVNLFRANLSSS